MEPETESKTVLLERELESLSVDSATGQSDRAAAEKRIDLMNDLVWEIALTESRRAREMGAEALESSRELEYDRGIAYGLRNHAYFHMIDTRLEEARPLAREAAEIFETLNEDLGLATATDILFITARGLGHFEEAIHQAHRTLQLNQKVKARRGEAWAHHSLGWLYSDLGDFDQAEDYLKKSLELFDDYDIGIIRSLGRLGDLYVQSGRLTEARETLERTVTMAESSNAPVVMGGALQELGHTLLQLREYAQAERILRRCLAIPELINRDVRSRAHRDLGGVLLAGDRLAEAHAELETALSEIVDTNSRTTEFTIYLALAEVEERLGNVDRALHYWKRFHETREIVFNDDSRRNMKNLEIRLKVEQAEAEAEKERQRATELNREREKSEKLLRNILPDSVATELKETGRARPRHFDRATVLFTDFVGFTRIAERLTPAELIEELDRCFSYFDSLMERYQLEKLKTIGDAFMCAGGIPEPNATHAIDCALAALEIRDFMQQMKEVKAAQDFDYWELRIGIASGPLVAGVIGEKKFAYDVWGDTVNTASRMESAGSSGRVNIAQSTYDLIGDLFVCEARGQIEVKNKGPVAMHFLDGLRPELSVNGEGRVPNEKFREEYAKRAL